MADDDVWLQRARRLAALAQTGLHYTQGVFDRERYDEIRTIAHDMLADLAGGTPPRSLAGLMLDQPGYVTPKVDVRAFVRDADGAVLLVRERAEGLWSLPGGWADVTLSPFEIAVKEAREESGYAVSPRRLLAVYERSRHGHDPEPWSVYKIFVGCTLDGGEARNSSETDGVGFFPLDGLPPLSTRRITEAQIRRLTVIDDDDAVPADCD